MTRRQQELEGMQTPAGDEELDGLAVNQKILSKKRKRAQDAESEGFLRIEKRMKDLKISRYVHEEAGLEVIISITEKVKVNEIEQVAEAAAGDAEGDDDEIEMAGEGEQKARKKKPKNGEAPAEA